MHFKCLLRVKYVFSVPPVMDLLVFPNCLPLVSQTDSPTPSSRYWLSGVGLVRKLVKCFEFFIICFVNEIKIKICRFDAQHYKCL